MFKRLIVMLAWLVTCVFPFSFLRADNKDAEAVETNVLRPALEASRGFSGSKPVRVTGETKAVRPSATYAKDYRRGVGMADDAQPKKQKAKSGDKGKNIVGDVMEVALVGLMCGLFTVGIAFGWGTLILENPFLTPWPLTVFIAGALLGILITLGFSNH